MQFGFFQNLASFGSSNIFWGGAVLGYQENNENVDNNCYISYVSFVDTTRYMKEEYTQAVYTASMIADGVANSNTVGYVVSVINLVMDIQTQFLNMYT